MAFRARYEEERPRHCMDVRWYSCGLTGTLPGAATASPPIRWHCAYPVAPDFDIFSYDLFIPPNRRYKVASGPEVLTYEVALLASVHPNSEREPPGRNSPVACNCVVELVGLEPTTRGFWNGAVSDQLPRRGTGP